MIESLDRPDYSVSLPDWVVKLRPQQARAVNSIVKAFERVDLVILDAPVGSGKTLIGELVRQELNRKAVYICTDRALQDQVISDFPYAQVLKGRSNYLPTKATGAITCEDCQLPGGCMWCHDPGQCPYRVAKEGALASDFAVLNTSLFLAASNHAGFFTSNDLVVADECDLLEDGLIGFIEFEVPKWLDKLLGLEYPVKSARKQTLVKWLDEFRVEIQDVIRGLSNDPKRQRAANGLLIRAGEVYDALVHDLDEDTEDDQFGLWIRDYDTDTFKMRPVTVDQQAKRMLWSHGTKWLLMSGTVVSADELAESLGWEKDFELVTVPSTFPVENRKIIIAPVAEMTRKVGDRDWRMLVTAIESILERHEGRALIHTISYKLAEYLVREVKTDRAKISHSNSLGKPGALERFRRTSNAVLFSPSCNRGVDLYDDLCRVQVIVKCPYPSLGDRQVSARLRLPGGDLWYAVKTVRDIVQMTGRGVRSKTDHCVTYVLDKQFTKNIWRRHQKLFVKSFRDAIKLKEDNTWLLR